MKLIKEDVENFKCALCKKEIKGYGNNGQPLVNGKVCDQCNKEVIKARLSNLKESKRKKKEQGWFVKYNSGNPEQNQAIFNNNMTINTVGGGEGLGEAFRPVPKEFSFVETPEFSKKFNKLGLNIDDLLDLQDCLKTTPPQAALGTNIYKFRWSPKRWRTGKSGATRVIYGEYIIDRQVYLITIFKKNEKESLTRDEEQKIRNQFKIISKE